MNPPREGDVLGGRYRLSRQLGEGGIGVVWAADQVTTGKKVAIKLLKEEPNADVSRFLREAKIVSQLTHPNIVQVFDFWDGREGTPVFMVMELLAGESLATRLQRIGRLTAHQTAEVALPIVRALEVAHAAGVVHRDLKPDNVFIAAGPPEIVKVLDFGIAKPTNVPSDHTQLTRTGTVLGTPRYMSPEQVYGEADIDGRSDIWSFGVLLYECLVGIAPFDGDNYGQIFRGITEKRRVSVQQAVPGVPPPFEALVMRMLSHDRASRPSLAEIARVLSGGSMSLPPIASQSSTQPMASLAPAPPAASHRSVALVGLVIAAAAVGGAGWYARSAKTPPPRAEPAVSAPAVGSSPPAPAPVASEIPALAVSSIPTSADAGRPSRTGRKPRPSASTPGSAEPVDPLDQGRF
ncbi:MAG: protein kinase [Labilithrix sp.]